jgi:hypothetical protein
MIRNIHFWQARVQVIRSNKKWENGTVFTSNRLRSKSSEWSAWGGTFPCIVWDLSIFHIPLMCDGESCHGGSLQGLAVIQLCPWVHPCAHDSPKPLPGQREVTSLSSVLSVMAQEQEWLLWTVNVGWKLMWDTVVHVPVCTVNENDLRPSLYCVNHACPEER